jgi:hypothetical protein
VDSLITAAARALAAGDALGALNRVALRDDAPALALRGIAMAQLGDLARARVLLRRAARAFGAAEAVARARCVVAEGEIALVSRDLLGWRTRALETARIILDAHGDRLNAAHARYLEIRRLLLVGRLDEADARLAEMDPARVPPASRTVHELALAGIAMRRLRIRAARAALARAGRAAREARIPALAAEVEHASHALKAPAARLIAGGRERLLRLADVERLLASPMFVVDACRHAVRHGGVTIPLARRPVLFALARALGEAWPGDAPREALLARAFGARFADQSHRARLRVEMGRLRAALRPLAAVSATPRGFVLAPHRARTLAVLARPAAVDDAHAAVLALLADGEAWSSSAIAMALGTSQRGVQRALEALQAAGRAQSLGRGRARRWTAPAEPGFTTALLLPGPLADWVG